MLRLKIMHTCIYNIGNKDCNGALNEYIISMSLTKINHSEIALRSIQIRDKKIYFVVFKYTLHLYMLPKIIRLC